MKVRKPSQYLVRANDDILLFMECSEASFYILQFYLIFAYICILMNVAHSQKIYYIIRIPFSIMEVVAQ